MLRFVRSLIVALFLVGVACAQTWQIDSNHSAVQFSVRHLGISTVRGAFAKVSGTAQYDPNDVPKTSIEATIDAASVNTRVEGRDKDLRGPNFFDVEKFPTLTFKSTKTEAAGNGRLKMTGDLTMHGVTKEVVLDVEGPTAPMKDGRGSLHIGALATTKISRKEFGVSGAAVMVGDEVSITLDVELVQPAAPTH